MDEKLKRLRGVIEEQDFKKAVDLAKECIKQLGTTDLTEHLVQDDIIDAVKALILRLCEHENIADCQVLVNDVFAAMNFDELFHGQESSHSCQEARLQLKIDLGLPEAVESALTRRNFDIASLIIERFELTPKNPKATMIFNRFFQTVMKESEYQLAFSWLDKIVKMNADMLADNPNAEPIKFLSKVQLINFISARGHFDTALKYIKQFKVYDVENNQEDREKVAKLIQQLMIIGGVKEGFAYLNTFGFRDPLIDQEGWVLPDLVVVQHYLKDRDWSAALDLISKSTKNEELVARFTPEIFMKLMINAGDWKAFARFIKRPEIAELLKDKSVAGLPSRLIKVMIQKHELGRVAKYVRKFQMEEEFPLHDILLGLIKTNSFDYYLRQVKKHKLEAENLKFQDILISQKTAALKQFRERFADSAHNIHQKFKFDPELHKELGELVFTSLQAEIPELLAPAEDDRYLVKTGQSIVSLFKDSCDALNSGIAVPTRRMQQFAWEHQNQQGNRKSHAQNVEPDHSGQQMTYKESFMYPHTNDQVAGGQVSIYEKLNQLKIGLPERSATHLTQMQNFTGSDLRATEHIPVENNQNFQLPDNQYEFNELVREKLRQAKTALHENYGARANGNGSGPDYQSQALLRQLQDQQRREQERLQALQKQQHLLEQQRIQVERLRQAQAQQEQQRFRNTVGPGMGSSGSELDDLNRKERIEKLISGLLNLSREAQLVRRNMRQLMIEHEKAAKMNDHVKQKQIQDQYEELKHVQTMHKEKENRVLSAAKNDPDVAEAVAEFQSRRRSINMESISKAPLHGMNSSTPPSRQMMGSTAGGGMNVNQHQMQQGMAPSQMQAQGARAMNIGEHQARQLQRLRQHELEKQRQAQVVKQQSQTQMAQQQRQQMHMQQMRQQAQAVAQNTAGYRERDREMAAGPPAGISRFSPQFDPSLLGRSGSALSGLSGNNSSLQFQRQGSFGSNPSTEQQERSNSWIDAPIQPQQHRMQQQNAQQQPRQIEIGDFDFLNEKPWNNNLNQELNISAPEFRAGSGKDDMNFRGDSPFM